jgi:hypothetical protein
MKDPVYEELRQVVLDWWIKDVYLPALDEALDKAFNTGDWKDVERRPKDELDPSVTGLRPPT